MSMDGHLSAATKVCLLLGRRHCILLTRTRLWDRRRIQGMSPTRVPPLFPLRHPLWPCRYPQTVLLSACVLKTSIWFASWAISKQQGSPIVPFCSLTPITDPAVGALSVQWNMGSPEELALSLSNGTLLLLSVAQDVTIACKKENMNANIVCWSPKGKQLAVGFKDGKVLQLSKTLDVKKSYPCPEDLAEPHKVSGLYWLSTHLFAVVYTPLTPPSPGGMSPAPSLMLLTAPNET